MTAHIRLGVLRLLLLALLTGGLLALGPAGRATAVGHSVQMAQYAFAPQALTITAGDTVTWTNQDTAPHDVTTSSAPVAIHSPELQKGQSWSYTFTTPGTYTYYCSVHPDMIARVVVTAAATHSQTPASAPAASAPAAPVTHPATRRTTSSAPRTAAGAHSASPVTAATSPSAAVAPASAAPVAAAAIGGGAQSATTTATTTVAATGSSPRPLDPLLMLAGLVIGVAVLCLLLVGSRASADARQDAEAR
jgi:amicyanin